MGKKNTDGYVFINWAQCPKCEAGVLCRQVTLTISFGKKEQREKVIMRYQCKSGHYFTKHF